MSNDPSLDLQKAFVDALKGDDVLASLMGGSVRAYDRVPDEAEFPYLHIGDDQTVDNSTSCGFAAEVFSRVHIWSRTPGRVEAKKIGARVRQLLNIRHVLQDHTISVSAFLSADYQKTEIDLETHGIIQFRYLIWPKSST